MVKKKVFLPFVLGSTALGLFSLIWSDNMEVLHKDLYEQTELPQMTLMVRTAALPYLTYQFYCMFLRTATFFWPATFGDIVVILDHESIDDRRFGYALQQQVLQYFPEYNLKMYFERQPRNEKIWNFPNDKNIGYNRQLYSTFISDRYTSSDIIIYMDADTQFRTPITLNYLLKDGKLKAFGNTPVSFYWMEYWRNSTETALGLKMVANFMVTFPQAVFRDTYINCRRHILKRFGTDDFESAMENFFGPGKLLSPINVIMNYAWHFERDRYDWHLAIADAEKINKDLQRKDQIKLSDMIPSIIAIPHVMEKQWNESLMIPGYCASMAAVGQPVPKCKNITHDFDNFCHFHNEHHRFAWAGVGLWCEEGKLNKCCEKATNEHYLDVAVMVKSGLHSFNKTKPQMIQNLAKEVGVTCEPLSLP